MIAFAAGFVTGCVVAPLCILLALLLAAGSADRQLRQDGDEQFAGAPEGALDHGGSL